jgi:DNA invertase Pin-like site-specific DNA recombinase
MTTKARTGRLLLRLSHEKEEIENEEAAFRRQEVTCRRWAESEGLEITGVYREGIVSAYKDVRRPEWERAFSELLAGDYDVLVTYKLARLSRKGAAEVAKVLDALEGTGRGFVAVDDHLDSRVKSQRLIIVVFSELAREQSATTETLVRAAKAQHRAEGRWLGGLPPWGWRVVVKTLPAGTKYPESYLVDPDHPRPGGLVLDQGLAPTLRGIVSEVMGGRTIRSIAAALTAAGVPCPRGGRAWRNATLSNWLRSPVLCGWQPTNRWDVYVHPDTGQPVEVAEPLISRAERAALIAHLNTRSTPDGRGKTKDGRGKKKSKGRVPTTLLGGGFAYCAECGSRMAADSSRRTYRCMARAASMPCDGCSINISGTDEYVFEAFTHVVHGYAHYGTPDDPFLRELGRRWIAHTNPEAIAERQAHQAEVDNLRAQMAAMDAAFAQGVYGDPATPRAQERFRVAVAPLEANLDAAEAALAAVPDPQPDLNFFKDEDRVRKAWAAADVATRRVWLGLAIERVEISKGTRGHFDPMKRIRFRWAGGQRPVWPVQAAS